MEDAAPQDEGSMGPSEGGGRSRPEQDDGVLDRLLSRAELELSDPDAVQRREVLAHLKLAAASAKAEDTLEVLEA